VTIFSVLPFSPRLVEGIKLFALNSSIDSKSISLSSRVPTRVTALISGTR